MLDNLIKEGLINTDTWDVKKALKNPNRKEIYELVKGKKLSITEISDKIGLSYQNTFLHIKKLKTLGLVETEKQQKVQGRTVIVTASQKSLGEIEKENYEKFTRKLRKIVNKKIIQSPS